MSKDWQQHPKLRGRFHAEYPDDIQVMVHDGGPRITKQAPEVVWVRVSGCAGDMFTGMLLNQPFALRSISEGSQIQSILPVGSNIPLMVTAKHLKERSDWVVQPCEGCGLAELFDAPSDLIKVVFPNPPEVLEMFTASCGACGGVQVVIRKSSESDEQINPSPSRKKWWELWK